MKGDEEAEFEMACAAASAKEPKPSRGRRDGPSPRIAQLRGEKPPTAPQRSKSPTRATTTERKQSSSEELEAMASALRKARSRSPRPKQRQQEGPARKESSSEELEKMASSLRKSRNSTGNVRSMSPRRGPRRVKSGGDVHEPAHRSLSPCRSCLSPCPDKKKKGMRRQVSFGTKCYEDIPKAEEAEKNIIWYDKAELKDLRKQVKKLARKGLENESEDCWRGLEPYVVQYQNKKSNDGSPSEIEKCKQLLLDAQVEKEKRKSEELKKMAQDLLNRFSEQGAKVAAQDEAEARAIYLETMDSEQVTKCFETKCTVNPARGA